MQEPLFKYFRTLYDQIPYPVQIINEMGKIVYVNHAFTFQWDFNLSDLKEYSIFTDSELKKCGADKIIKETLQKGNHNFINNYADSLLKSKEITPPVFRTKIFPVSYEDKIHVVLFHDDHTEIALAEAEIKKSRDNNKEMERLKDTFLTVLSHELRTPLNIILGYTSILKDSMKDKISPEDKVYLDNLYSGSERLSNSITQMLEFAQIEAGNYVINIETINLNTILTNCVDTNKESALNKKLSIKTNLSTEKILIDVDIQSLESAINNILNNAVKFTRQGFVEIETGIIEERDVAFCKIQDSGVGISTEYMDHLFRPFSQEDLNIGRNYEGNGLSLALAKRYLEKMGGSLLVDSIKGVGSTFTLILPLSQKTNHTERLREYSKTNSSKKPNY
jgi:signal transduction histidine kinase